MGVHAGSTFVAATMGHEITSFAVDDYSEQNISPFREDDIQSEGRVTLGHKGYQMSNPKNTILRSLRPNQHFYAKSIQDLKFPMFHGKKANVIFYDADHEPQATYDNLTYLYTVMDDQFIIVIDDANFMGVVEAVNIWVKENEIKVMFDRKILTAIPEDPNSWWNGIHVMVCKK